ncbi:MAG TPA: hypothetical protein VGK29_08280 [Paludibaculum sp.]|jgi:hypothetical protein
MAPPPSRDIIARLPRTFGPALNDQFRQWDLLFPAEQRSFQAQVEWLARLPAPDFKKLFAPIVEIEGRMDLPGWNASAAGLSVQDAGVLARSPLYPRWRTEVERVFATIDDSLESSAAAPRPPRLVVCTLPPGPLPAGQAVWPDLAAQGAWVQLERPFGEMEESFLAALARRPQPPGIEEVESTWLWDSAPRPAAQLESTSATVVSWSGTAAVRREFLNRLNTIRRDLHSVDQTNDDLRRFEISRLLGAKLGGHPRIRELVRSVLLSGNGSLVFGNSFVQWGASETLRRVQPRLLLARFGIRPKLKAFSSAVLFEDQAKNQQLEEDDPAGSLIDSLLLAQYVHLAALRQRAFQDRTMTVLALAELDRVLILGAPPPPPAGLSAAQLSALALSWLQTGSRL